MSSHDVETQTDKSELAKQQRIKTALATKEPEEPTRYTDVQEFENDCVQIEKIVIQSCEFEIFGIVQDVSFRHYTLRRAQKLGIRGWCMNSDRGTVKGLIQGLPRNFEAMRLWLKYTGSPTSRIDKCVFGPITELDDFTYDDFSIRGNQSYGK